MHAAMVDIPSFQAPLEQTPSIWSLLGLPSESRRLHEEIQKGVHYKIIDMVAKKALMDTATILKAIHLSGRTLARRKETGRLQPVESDRLVSFLTVYNEALQLFGGNAEKATKWLSSAERALGGQRPIDYIVTELGTREVLTLINRLEHGVFV